MPDVARISAGTLLLNETRTRKAIQSAIGDGVDGASAMLSRERKDRLRNSVIIAAMLVAAQSMAARIEQAILGGRKAAREASRRRLSIELGAAGISIEAGAMSPVSGLDEDGLRAQSSAGAIASVWRGMAIAEAVKALRGGKSPSPAIDATRGMMKPRAARTAQVEVATAYNAEHAAALRSLSDRDLLVDIAPGEQIVRRWDAQNDKRTCSHCAHQDGEEVGIDEDFSGGSDPGSVHVGCRCIEVVYSVPKASRRAA